MSIASQITRLQNIKTAIRNALVGKGVTDASAHDMDDFADDIESIRTYEEWQPLVITHMPYASATKTSTAAYQISVTATFRHYYEFSDILLIKGGKAAYTSTASTVSTKNIIPSSDTYTVTPTVSDVSESKNYEVYYQYQKTSAQLKISAYMYIVLKLKYFKFKYVDNDLYVKGLYGTGKSNTLVYNLGKGANESLTVDYLFGFKQVDLNQLTDLTTLPAGFMRNESLLETIIFYNNGINITSISDYAFYGCSSLTSLSFGNVTSIGYHTFQNCSSLTSISDLSNVTSINDYAFYGCSSLTSLSFGNVTSISIYAFEDCSSLTSLSFGNVTLISQYAFYNCSGLQSVDLTHCTSVPKLESYNAFSGVSSTLQIKVPASLYDEWIIASNWSSASVKSKIVAV